MKVVFLVSALALACGPIPARAQPPPRAELEAAATAQLIEVKSDFRGAAITIFGAAPERAPGGDFVVTLQGPAETLVVRRKRRILGLWINTDPVRFREAPSFFALFATRRLDRIVFLIAHVVAVATTHRIVILGQQRFRRFVDFFQRGDRRELSRQCCGEVRIAWAEKGLRIVDQLIADKRRS
ncbi:MAG: TIGR02186 family protein, partial [Hyphomonadaceae bacterium]|nr:TIGR02186 family protein [Hyphomonadaceae bacterium]